jgi:hypothetical protein
MSSAFSIGGLDASFKNIKATTTIPAYTGVCLCTTEGAVSYWTTKGYDQVGVTQEAINPLVTGRVRLLCGGGVSRIKMSSGAYTTARLATTSILVGIAANGRGYHITTTTLFPVGKAMVKWAASDIVEIQLVNSIKSKI